MGSEPAPDRPAMRHVSFAGRVRVALRVAALFFALLVCVPLHYLYRVFAYGSPFPKLFLATAARICGARVESVGTALRRDVLFLANHVSWLDILALAGASGTAFVAKAELGKAPVIGWLAGLNRTVYVQREDRMNIAAQINAVREALADNWALAIFPEGTTTDGQSLLPFKTSMLKMLEPPPGEVLVQPVYIDYGALAGDIGWVGAESGLSNAIRVLARRGTFPVRLHFLAPFDPEDCTGRKDIATRARCAIERELCRTLGRPPREFAHEVAPVGYRPKPTPDDPPT